MNIHQQLWIPDTCNCKIVEQFDLDIQGYQDPTFIQFNYQCDKHSTLPNTVDSFNSIRAETEFKNTTLASVETAEPNGINFTWSYNADNTILTVEYDDNTGHQIETYNRNPIVNTNGTN